MAAKAITQGWWLILLIVAVPLLFIWALNVLLGTNLPFNFTTWFAAVLFIGIPLVVIAVFARKVL